MMSAISRSTRSWQDPPMAARTRRQIRDLLDNRVPTKSLCGRRPPRDEQKAAIFRDVPNCASFSSFPPMSPSFSIAQLWLKHNVNRGLRFNSADHAIDAAVECAGVLLVHDILAYDSLRAGRLIVPFQLTLRSRRAYHFVCPRSRQHQSCRRSASGLDRKSRRLIGTNS
jgi:DNA-binding transcriptional LysR family regulator